MASLEDGLRALSLGQHQLEEDDIDVEVEPSSTKVKATWSLPNHRYSNFEYKVTVSRTIIVTRPVAETDVRSKEVEITELSPGETYTITVTAGSYKGSTTFRTVFSKDELELLMDKAKSFAGHIWMRSTNSFIRDKNSDHFINDVMKPYIKDNNGDQASPINGQIKGLFFSTEACNPSFFGDRRLEIPAKELFTENNRLYFADFYCKSNSRYNNRPHYVTVVMTMRGSDVDQEWCQKLPELDIHNNQFLERDVMGQVTFMHTTRKMHLEVLYTDDINIQEWKAKGATVCHVASKGTSRPGGIPKDSSCSHCNLYPSTSTSSSLLNLRALLHAQRSRSYSHGWLDDYY